MAHIDNLDFLNANSVRSFPIKEGRSGASVNNDGLFVIPDNFIVDLLMSYSSSVNNRFFISKIQNFAELIVIEVSNQDDDTNPVIGTFTIEVVDHVRYKSYYMAPSESFVRATGRIVVAELDGVLSQPTSTHLFDLVTAELEMRCNVPSLAHIDRFLFVDEKGVTHGLTGNVVIRARNNLRFRDDGGAMVLDAGDGLGLNQDCGPEAPCIKTIRNIAPDEDGDFTLIGVDCIQFDELANPPGLAISETCCKPCLGCDEIGELTQRAMQVESDLLKLRDHVANMELTIATFATTLNFTCDC